MSQAIGYAASDKDSSLAPLRFERREPEGSDVEIDVLYCGVCHSDLHQVKNDWGNSVYPCLPGHEIVGRVTRVGPEATQFKEGDLVGVGCMIDSCQECEACKAGIENYCEGPNSWLATYNGPMKPSDPNMYGTANTYGGYSDHIVVREGFVLRIPENLELKGVAPLLCAGVTTYSPLRHWKVEAGQKVGVVGLGGLGHMAVQIATAMGAEVTVFSTSPEKEAAAKELGAKAFVLWQDEEAMTKLAETPDFDFILTTVPEGHDINALTQLLKRDSTLTIVGALAPMAPLNNMKEATMRRSVAGSLIGSIAETQEVLDFCGEHNITSWVEVIPIAEINEAFTRMNDGDVRFRFVIDMATLEA